MTKVYMLSTYGEYGAENVRATLDRGKLVGMIQSWDMGQSKWQAAELEAWKTEAIAGLGKALERFDANPTMGSEGQNIHSGWGGMQVHVVELE
jgi:hypothetical protein